MAAAADPPSAAAALEGAEPPSGHEQQQQHQEEGEEPVCRVCHMEAEPAGGRPLCRPCKCRGSISSVHQDCLLQWLEASRNAQVRPTVPAWERGV